MLSTPARWFGLQRDLGERYSPLYFLAALGNGGLAVSFFIYLNFMLPHPNTPIITYDGIAVFLGGTRMLPRVLVLVAMAAIIFFGLTHVRLLIWNLREFARFRKTPAYHDLHTSSAAASLMGQPVTLAMTINVLFVSGAVFVPGLWGFVEYLFPFALAGFLAVGILALRVLLATFGRTLAEGNYDCARNNSLSQLQKTMTFTMVAVGSAAPAAMSDNRITIAVSILMALFFLGAAVLVGVPLLVLGFRSMLSHGLNVAAGASVWNLIPILTLAGITLIRISHGMHHGFEAHTEPATMFLLTGTIVTFQLLVGIIGYGVLRQVNYFGTYVWGPERTPASYGLICPGVAFFVFGMFFIHQGLVQNGLVVKYSLPYFLTFVPFVAAQVAAIVTMLRLDAKLLRPHALESLAADAAAV